LDAVAFAANKQSNNQSINCSGHLQSTDISYTFGASEILAEWNYSHFCLSLSLQNRESGVILRHTVSSFFTQTERSILVFQVLEFQFTNKGCYGAEIKLQIMLEILRTNTFTSVLNQNKARIPFIPRKAKNPTIRKYHESIIRIRF
jgi:hypothetical protein